MKWAATAAAALALALITFFQFPGHTWLQQDSQIYVPILEHLRDPALLRNDILAQKPHVAFTLYDESALMLRSITHLDFREVLAVEQILTRALGILGFYWMATALGLSVGFAWMVAAICSLGATVVGPSVLTFEYEPTPRAFAVPLLICAMGLTAHRRYVAAAIAAAAAFLYHPPTALPFWLVFGIVILANREGKEPALRLRLQAFIPLVAAGVILMIAAASQAGSAESQSFFSRLPPLQEQLQHMRAPYVWISTWKAAWVFHYLILSGILVGAWIRIRREIPSSLTLLLWGLPALGLLSMPFSWLFLEHWHWALMPQLQPLRALLFITLAMQFLTAAAGAIAATRARPFEALGWFVAAYLLPLQPVTTDPPQWVRLALVISLAALTAFAGKRGWVVAAGAFLAIPMIGGVVNYPHLHTAELAQFSAWARTSTAPDSVFLFPDAGHALDPGIFRSEALRAVYVDWKGGGQVNYFQGFAEQWWFRWQQTVGRAFTPSDLPRYGALGVQYVILRPESRLPRPPVFENAKYLAYPLP